MPLFTPEIHAPIEVAGTGLAPEVTVRVTVDASGRVTDVEVTSIQPASQYDEIFTRTTRETLLRWRYAPARADGAPVGTTLEWMIQYPTPNQRREEPRLVLSYRSIDSGERALDAFRQRILSLPLERRVRMLAEQAEIAHDCLVGERHVFSSDRFKVYAGGPEEKIAETLALNLEATFNVLSGIIGGDITLQPEPYKVVAFMYSTEREFSTLKQRIQGVEWSDGFYNPLGLLAFHRQMPSNESLVAVMLHEATHAFLDRYIARPGVLFPRWLDEGLAEYVGNSKIKKGELIPGKTRSTEVYRGAWGVSMGRSTARYSVDEVKSAMRRGRALSLARLIQADVAEFYGEERLLYYPESWLLIHFLRHGREEWNDERFSRLVLYVAEGYPAATAFTAIYAPPEQLEDEFRDYVKRF